MAEGTSGSFFTKNKNGVGKQMNEDFIELLKSSNKEGMDNLLAFIE